MFITGIKTILSKLLFSVKHFCGVCVPASPKHLCVSIYVYFVADFFFFNLHLYNQNTKAAESQPGTIS